MELEAKVLRSIITDLADSSDFDRYFKFHRALGSGSDGQVSAYTHRSSNLIIAVKIPCAGRYWAFEVIRKEAKALKAIGAHGKQQNIAHMLAYQSTFGAISYPAIFSERAEFGSLLNYRIAWCEQEAMCASPTGIPEPTMWKLFKDMILALDFLHNKCGFIHRDVKSDNILVARSPTDYDSAIPKIPVFKLCDFSRAVAYPSTDEKLHRWAGTIDYAPPLTERREDEPARPAGDMWSLGATLEDFAMGINPIQSRKAFVEQMNKWEEPHPKLQGDEALWTQALWRSKFSAAYRPLNVTASTLIDRCDVHTPLSRSYKPFSHVLNNWYKKLWVVDPDLRATSASLVKELIPMIDVYIGLVKTQEQRRADSVLATQIFTPPVTRQLLTCDSAGHHAQAAASLRKARGPDQAPSYEGNDYALSSEFMSLREQQLI